MLTCMISVRKQTEIAEAQQEAELKTAVIVITTETFEKLVLESSDMWIIQFYVPWSADCRRLVRRHSVRSNCRR